MALTLSQKILARVFAPIFFENCVNGAILLPLAATLPSWPATGTPMQLVVSSMGSTPLRIPGIPV